MASELRDLLTEVKTTCGGSYSKMGMRLGIGATSVLAYFKDDVLPGFDKIAVLAQLGGKSEDYVRALLTKAHEERARRRRSGNGDADRRLSAPTKPGAKVTHSRLHRGAFRPATAGAMAG